VQIIQERDKVYIEQQERVHKMFFSGIQTPATPQKLDLVATVNLISEVYEKIKNENRFAVSMALSDICYFCGWNPAEIVAAEASLHAYGHVNVPSQTSGSTNNPNKSNI
jgi:hypothetical protein